MRMIRWKGSAEDPFPTADNGVFGRQLKVHPLTYKVKMNLDILLIYGPGRVFKFWLAALSSLNYLSYGKRELNA